MFENTLPRLDKTIRKIDFKVRQNTFKKPFPRQLINSFIDVLYTGIANKQLADVRR